MTKEEVLQGALALNDSDKKYKRRKDLHYIYFTEECLYSF